MDSSRTQRFGGSRQGTGRSATQRSFDLVGKRSGVTINSASVKAGNDGFDDVGAWFGTNEANHPPPSAKFVPSSASRGNLMVPSSSSRRVGSLKASSSKRGRIGSASRDPPAFADGEDSDEYGLQSEEEDASASSEGETAVTGSADEETESEGNADETLGDASTVGGNTTVSDLSAILPDDDEDDESITPRKGRKKSRSAAESGDVGASVRAAADEALARARALAERATAKSGAATRTAEPSPAAAAAARRGSLGTSRRGRRATISQGTSPGMAVVRSVSATVGVSATAAAAPKAKPAMVSTGAGQSVTPPSKRSAASASTASSTSAGKRSATKASRRAAAALEAEAAAAAPSPAPAAAASGGSPDMGGAAFDHYDDGFDAGDFGGGEEGDDTPLSPEQAPPRSAGKRSSSTRKAAAAAADSSDEDVVPSSAAKRSGKGGKGGSKATKGGAAKSKASSTKGGKGGKKTGRAASRTIGGPSQRRSLSFAPDTKGSEDEEGGGAAAARAPYYDSSSEDEGKWLSPGGRDKRRLRKSLGRVRRETTTAAEAEELGMVRRSGRRRWEPLKYWSGEHLTYTRADEEDPVAEVMPIVVDAYKEGAIETEEERRERREAKRMEREGGVKRTRSTKRSSRTSKRARKGDEGGAVQVRTVTKTKTVVKKVPTDPKDLPPLPKSALPDDVEVADDARFTVAGVDGQPSQVFPVYRPAAELRLQALPVMERPDGVNAAARAGAMFDTPLFVNGLITLDPLAYKEPENTGHCTQVFFVVSCQPSALEINIAGKTFLGSPGDHFWVPTNTLMTVKNHSPEVKAELSFVLLKPQ